MKRQKRFKGLKVPSFLEGLKKMVVKKTAAIVVILIFLSLVLLLTKAFLYRSDYFRLRSVGVKDNFLEPKAGTYISSQLFNLYKGRNIFRIDLKGIAESLEVTYPDAKEMTVRIALPDKIVVYMKFRKPVAFVRNTKLYPVDEEGYVLPSFDVGSIKDLPVIDGVRLRYDEKRGKKSSSGNLKVALDLLRELKKAKFLKNYGANRIDARDLENLSFYLASGIEVRIGPENFKDRLETLSRTLKDPRLVMDKIKYIDLRFKDVVIGPSDS